MDIATGGTSAGADASPAAGGGASADVDAGASARSEASAVRSFVRCARLSKACLRFSRMRSSCCDVRARGGVAPAGDAAAGAPAGHAFGVAGDFGLEGAASWPVRGKALGGSKGTGPGSAVTVGDETPVGGGTHGN
jgi:hypothetical protein